LVLIYFSLCTCRSMHKFPKKPSEAWVRPRIFRRCAEACADFAQPLCIESHALVPSLLLSRCRQYGSAFFYFAAAGTTSVVSSALMREQLGTLARTLGVVQKQPPSFIQMKTLPGEKSGGERSDPKYKFTHWGKTCLAIFLGRLFLPGHSNSIFPPIKTVVCAVATRRCSRDECTRSSKKLENKIKTV